MLLILQACQVGCGYLMVELIMWKIWELLLEMLDTGTDLKQPSSVQSGVL